MAYRSRDAPTGRHLAGSPALVTEHLFPLPVLVRPCLPIHFIPLSSFQTPYKVPSSPDLAAVQTVPPNRKPHRDPRSGKIRSNPVHHTWPLKLSLFYTYILSPPPELTFSIPPTPRALPSYPASGPPIYFRPFAIFFRRVAVARAIYNTAPSDTDICLATF